MSQLFSPSANTVARAVIVGGVLGVTLALGAGLDMYWSSFNTDVGVAVNQTVPFSHKHHVAGLGIDCRYCHTGVEKSRFAGIPPTETCMTCHSQVWRDAPVLAPVRESWAQQRPLHWTRVNDLPDYVYFDHSIHVSKGIGCVSCHGQVDEMPLMAKGQTLAMRWCLGCHRAPEKQIRPVSEVFNMKFHRSDGTATGTDLVRAYHVAGARLEDCTTCHR